MKQVWSFRKYETLHVFCPFCIGDILWVHYSFIPLPYSIYDSDRQQLFSFQLRIQLHFHSAQDWWFSILSLWPNLGNQLSYQWTNTTSLFIWVEYLKHKHCVLLIRDEYILRFHARGQKWDWKKKDELYKAIGKFSFPAVITAICNGRVPLATPCRRIALNCCVSELEKQQNGKKCLTLLLAALTRGLGSRLVKILQSLRKMERQ